ncbi:MAG TPA: hypothetical protein VFN68_13870 [Acidimicrobiales bacterium]|nr:hypothetical protein [Acidimicrobiales bacterium]
MQDDKHIRALSWIGSGGAVLVSACLVTSVVIATSPRPPAVTGSDRPPAATGAFLRARSPGVPGHTRAYSHIYPGGGKPNTVVSGTAASASLAAAPPLSPRAATAADRTPPGAASAWSTSLQQEHLAAPIVAAAVGRAGRELLLVGADGGLFPVGSAGFFGSLGGTRLAAPVTSVAADPASDGYWMAGADGGVFAFHAPYHGALSGRRLSAPIVAMAATPDGGGYWLAAADGGVFAFGDARYMGNSSRSRLASPIVAMAAMPSGDGYWLASGDGGVFGFGHAGYHGNAVGRTAGSPVTALVPSADGQGYWLAGTGGSVFAFGDAPPVGQTASAAALAAAALPPVDPSVARTAVSDLTAYPPGSVGMDISQYQCGQIPPGPTGVAVVQVTSGAIDNPPNPCYLQEAAWAGPRMSAYIYMDGLPEPAPESSLTGPAGACALIDAACESFNYGYNWARHWVAYSRSVGVYPKLWWLDVERYSGWRDTISNDLVVNGALLGLRSMEVQGGIYSTRPQWDGITGGLVVPGVPLWTAGAGNRSGPGYSADSYCADPGRYTFASGVLKLVQFGYQGPFPGSYSGPADPYDLDLACG